MTTQTAAPPKPFKFLDHYGIEDREIFFGRERESEILLSDVIATRLVVLFAKTGSGKTSLINAGVRPRLEELDYATFYVRVEKDPIASLRKTLESTLRISSQDQHLDALLEQAVDHIEKPIVVFFDQFEEFFIYIAEKKLDMARQFISEVANLYRNRDSGVHMVFSMREEFFVEMDAFRDEIPSIFHNDSNLRLRWFDADQARDAIVMPARRFDTHIEESLVERLIHDLQDGGRIEPARLQIVCDTLWQRRSDTSILLVDYEQMGGAERILDRRLVQDITANFDDEMLGFLEKLLPELITEHGTKNVRGFDELAKKLKWDPTLLQKLAEQLNALGLVRLSKYSGTNFFEWTSDYMAERTARLQERVRAVLLTRQLQSAMDKARKVAEITSQTKTGQLTFEQRDALYLSDEVFETLSAGADFLADLDREQAEFLFLAALEHGNHMRLWFDKASARGVPVWEILKNRITDESARIVQAESAVRLLGELKNRQALGLLELGLQTDTLSLQTVKVLGRIETPEAFQLLENALKQKALAPQVMAVLDQSGNPQAVALLQSALQQSDLASQAESELDRISKSKSTQAADYAGQVLEKWKTERQSPPAQPPHKPAKGFSREDWSILLRRIKDGMVTPLIGPQVLAGMLPSPAEIARNWASEYNYPLSHTDGLPQVAQYLAVSYDSLFAKEKFVEALKNVEQLPLTIEGNLHRVLGELPLSVYITTNYDSSMTDALKSLGKLPFRQLLQWNKFLRSKMQSDTGLNYRPSPGEPLVFHLFGVLEEPESLVLTEDDYLDWLFSIATNPDALPFQVQGILARTQLLLVGFDLMDPGFRVLLESLARFIEKRAGSSIVIQIPLNPEATIYIEKYYGQKKLSVYWGTPQEFGQELNRRWKEQTSGS